MEQEMINHGQHTDLIASNRVEGTTVYSRDGDKLGTISHVMISKRQGTVAFAVLKFGSFLGFGGEEHTVPWAKLDYDPGQGGYVVDLTEELLAQAPRYDEGNSATYGRDYYDGVSDYYGTTKPVY